MDEKIKFNISSTQIQLSQVLDQISELPSFKSTATSSTSSSSSSSSSFSSSTSVPKTTATTPTAATSPSSSPQQAAALQYVDQVFSNHISLLKAYNQIKDVAMGMLSILAEKQGRRLAEVMEDHGLTEDD